MIKNFRTYSIAVEFYHRAVSLKLAAHLKKQLERAASSIALNLQEGNGRFGVKDRKRFYHIAFGSLRECQAIFELARVDDQELLALTDKLAAHLYRLIQRT